MLQPETHTTYCVDVVVPRPGLWSAVLTTHDLSTNLKRARRVILYDPDPHIDINDRRRVYITSANDNGLIGPQAR